MNLLKTFFLLCLAASITIIFNNVAFATDHPWDDNEVDSSEGASFTNGEGTTPPKPGTTPIIRRLENWTRNFLRQVVVWGDRAVEEVVTRQGHVRRVGAPGSHRKFK